MRRLFYTLTLLILPLYAEDPAEDYFKDLSTPADLSKMVMTLAALLILIFLTIWLLKRLSRGAKHTGSVRAIHILEKRPLSPKTILYLIEVEGKRVLLSESQFDVQPISSLESSDQTENH